MKLDEHALRNSRRVCMDSEDWIALVGVVVAVIAVGLSVRALRYSRDSTKASREAADAALRSAQEAATISRIEKERHHEDLAPPSPVEITAELEESPRGAGQASLFGEIIVPRDYRVRATARVGNSFRQLFLPLLLQANRTHRFEIERWAPGQTEPQTDEIWFEFWPPVQGYDGPGPWQCSCDRPATDEPGSSGHWEWKIPVSYYGASASVW